MATKVHMEALSPTMEEGQVVRWLKSEGDAVTSGELLAEIETDKATMELVARGDGVLRKILVSEGSVAPVGEVIAIIAGADEDVASLLPGGGVAAAATDDAQTTPPAAQPTEASAPVGSPVVDGTPVPAPAALDEAAPPEVEGRVRASPLARKLAEGEGLPLHTIQGSGPGGRIVKRDVEQAAREGVTAASATPAAAPASSQAAPTAVAVRVSAPQREGDYRDLPLSQMRKTIAKRLVESIGPVPHFFLTIDVDMTRSVQARERINALLGKSGVKVSFNDIVLKATALALAKHPECNAHWGGDHIREFHRVHLGVAVAIPDGLITPVVRDAHLKGLAEIATEVRELAGRAREKKLKPEEYTGSTFSVSNLGMLGIDHFTGVINPPEAGILAVGALEDRPVVVDGEVRVQPRMKITMSCDHRIIDGALGATFLQTLRSILEEPLAALL